MSRFTAPTIFSMDTLIGLGFSAFKVISVKVLATPIGLEVLNCNLRPKQY